MTSLREASFDDVGAIASAGEGFWNEHYYSRFGEYDTEAAAAAIHAYIGYPDSMFMVFEDDGIKGFLCLAKMPVPWSDFYTATELLWWIAPEYRSRKVGRSMMDIAKQWASANGCALIEAHNQKGKRIVINV